MAAKKRSRGERESDLVFISKLYLKGISHQAITDSLNAQRQYRLTRSQVSRDIKTIHDHWRTAYLLDFNEAKVRELARLDELEHQYWQAWERSQNDALTTQEINIHDEINGNQAYTRKKHTRKSENQTGRETYLQGVQWCIEQRCKILGLTSPKTVNINWRSEAESLGINPDAIYGALVEQFVQAAERGVNDPGSNTPL